MRKVLLTLALVGLLALPLLAQRQGFQLDAVALLGNKSVQEELKLTDEQKEAIKKATEARATGFEKAKEDKDKDLFQKTQEEFTAAMKKVKEKLDEKQAKRLAQIEFQVGERFNSLKILSNEAVAKALKLTDKQKDAIKDASAEIEKDMKELREEAKGDFKKFGEIMKKGAEMNKAAFEKIVKTFDDDQKKAAEELRGEKFDLKFEGFGPKDKKKDEF